MKKKGHIIKSTAQNGIAREMGIEAGDRLLQINGKEMEDVFDYEYLIQDEYIEVLIEKTDGEEWLLEIDKEYGEELGVEFENSFMDEYRSCCNKCIFCFIDQMPKGMRETLYFKDDDSRLSFLQGNYVTLTNMKEHDLERIIKYKLGPINISVQTTNPELRCQMLNNRFAKDALSKMERLYQAGIPMNGQIVLCKGVNDGRELERTITDLMGYLPVMESVSVVPVGISRFREGLFPLEPFTKEEAESVLKLIHEFQEQCMAAWGRHFVHAGDEWYLLAGQELPEEERYDGYLQLENGVGMLRLLKTEFAEALKESQSAFQKAEPGMVTIATGLLAAPTMQELAWEFQNYFPEVKIQVIPVINHFFGELITVSGLLTGQDIIAQLEGRELGKKLLLPCNLLRSGEQIFLDDVTLAQVENALQVKIDIVKSSGQDLVSCLLQN